MPSPSEEFDILVKDIYPGIAPEKCAHPTNVHVHLLTSPRAHVSIAIDQGSLAPTTIRSSSVRISLFFRVRPDILLKGLTKHECLVTGAGTGLGLCAAKAFSRCGAKVYLTGRRPEPLEAAKAEIVASGGEADFTQMDVTDPKSVSAGVRAAVERFGKIDIVIANASRIPHPGQSKYVRTIGIQVYNRGRKANAPIWHLGNTAQGSLISTSKTGGPASRRISRAVS